MALATYNVDLSDARRGVNPPLDPHRLVKIRFLQCGYTSAAAVGRLVGMDAFYISKFVRGERRSVYWQRRISESLGVDPEWLWGEFCHESLRMSTEIRKPKSESRNSKVRVAGRAPVACERPADRCGTRSAGTLSDDAGMKTA